MRSSIFVVALYFSYFSSFAASGDPLSAEDVRKLITGKTVVVTVAAGGEQWKLYFSPDGQGYRTSGNSVGTWEVKETGEHCTTWANIKCARIVYLGDGKYGRLNQKGK